MPPEDKGRAARSCLPVMHQTMFHCLLPVGVLEGTTNVVGKWQERCRCRHHILRVWHVDAYACMSHHRMTRVPR